MRKLKQHSATLMPYSQAEKRNHINVIHEATSARRKKHKACSKKYKPYILKYKALILKYVPCIFRENPHLIFNNLQRHKKMPVSQHAFQSIFNLSRRQNEKEPMLANNYPCGIGSLLLYGFYSLM